MSLNGESSFRLHVVGNLSKKRVMLIHGMGFDWKNCFGSIADELKKEFCVLLPELNGHNSENKGTFTTVYDSADEIINEIEKLQVTEIECLYGISLGASIALEIALRKKLLIKKLILDGGQYESMGVKKYFFSFCMAMEFRKIINGKRMMEVVSKQMGYRNGDEKLILLPLCCKNLKFYTLYKSALAAYSYDIRNRKEKLDMKVIILHGEKEIYAAHSALIVQKKCIYGCEIKICEKCGHSELLSLNPLKHCDIIKK